MKLEKYLGFRSNSILFKTNFKEETPQGFFEDQGLG